MELTDNVCRAALGTNPSGMVDLEVNFPPAGAVTAGPGPGPGMPAGNIAPAPAGLPSQVDQHPLPSRRSLLQFGVLGGISFEDLLANLFGPFSIGGAPVGVAVDPPPAGRSDLANLVVMP